MGQNFSLRNLLEKTINIIFFGFFGKGIFKKNSPKISSKFLNFVNHQFIRKISSRSFSLYTRPERIRKFSSEVLKNFFSRVTLYDHIESENFFQKRILSLTEKNSFYKKSHLKTIKPIFEHNTVSYNISICPICNKMIYKKNSCHRQNSTFSLKLLQNLFRTAKSFSCLNYHNCLVCGIVIRSLQTIGQNNFEVFTNEGEIDRIKNSQRIVLKTGEKDNFNLNKANEIKLSLINIEISISKIPSFVIYRMYSIICKNIDKLHNKFFERILLPTNFNEKIISPLLEKKSKKRTKKILTKTKNVYNTLHCSRLKIKFNLIYNFHVTSTHKNSYPLKNGCFLI